MDVHFVVIKGNPRGKTLKFTLGEFLIGRGAECHIRPDSEWVSRQHCLLSITIDQIHLKDLGSTNGTLINGHRLIGERDLVHGDTVQIGPLVLQMRLPSYAAEAESIKQTDLSATPAMAAGSDQAPRAEFGPERSIDPHSATVEHQSFDSADILPPENSE